MVDVTSVLVMMTLTSKEMGMCKLFTASVITLTVIVLSILVYTPEGIIGLDDWEHGVAMCEYKDDVSMEMVDIKGGHMWTDMGITYVVNSGHLDDIEMIELTNVAHRVCAQYRN